MKIDWFCVLLCVGFLVIMGILIEKQVPAIFPAISILLAVIFFFCAINPEEEDEQESDGS